MWYAQFLAHRIEPERSLYLNSLTAINLRHAPHQDRDLEQFTRGEVISETFCSALRSKEDQVEFSLWQRSPKNSTLSNFSAGNEHFFRVTREDVDRIVDLEKVAGS